MQIEPWMWARLQSVDGWVMLRADHGGFEGFDAKTTFFGDPPAHP